MMKSRFLLFMVIALAIVSCKRAAEETSASSTSMTSTQASSTFAAPAQTQMTQTTQTTVTMAAPAPASSAPAGTSIASQETNWNGVTADVTEFRRKGNTVTAKVRFSNKGQADSRVDVQYREVYLIDTANGKKYQTLRDEKDIYIAALSSGWNDRWYEDLKAGESKMIWIKFPAPPPEVKAITLNLSKTAPFEDLAIQD